MRQRSAVTVETDAESLFRALDGRPVEHKGRKWRLVVCGIVSDATQRWIQMRLAGSHECLLTVRLGIAACASDYFESVRAWLDRAGSSDADLAAQVVSYTLLRPQRSSRSELRLVRSKPDPHPHLVVRF